MDKVGKEYWEREWNSGVPVEVWNPRKKNIRYFVPGRFHDFFKGIFRYMDPVGKKLLEIGCARSASLPYFAKEFDFEVEGIDYSRVGCDTARVMLDREGVAGSVHCEDFLHPPEKLKERYDVVVSFGVAEHFTDTSECISAFLHFLKPGGLMITVIPNMVGINGFLQRLISKDIFDIHLPLAREDLQEAHTISGLEIVSCNYFIFFNTGVVKGQVSSPVYPLFRKIGSLISIMFWSLERVLPALPQNRLTSPYICCVARRSRD